LSKNIIEVVFFKNTKQYQGDEPKIEKIVDIICKSLHLDSIEICVQFTNNDTIREINKKHRGIFDSTDVLSFPQNKWSVKPSIDKKGVVTSQIGEGLIPVHLGDVIIAPEHAHKNADEIGHTIDQEVCFLLVHGILHLCGYDHQEPADEIEMISQQKLIMKECQSLNIWCDCIKFCGNDK
jgi:probable rRNA maturation factor